MNSHSTAEATAEAAAEVTIEVEALKPPLSRGEAFENLAFTLCKVATFALFTGRFALPLAALGAATFFLLAHFNGKRDTRCLFKHPLLIAAFWALVALGWVWWNYGRRA